MDAVELERMLADVFAGVDPELAVRVGRADARSGRFSATIQSVPAQVEWLSPGWPRQVKDLLARPDRPDLVVAAELSAGARELLTEAGVSWVDATGAARVSLPGVYIRVDVGQPPKKARAVPGWTPATLAICEALIVGVRGTVVELTSATGMAASTVAGSLRFLQDSQLLESEAARGRNSRRTVVDPDQLLDTYAAAAAQLRTPESIRVGVLWRDAARAVKDLGARLDANAVAWSVTGALAADALAPYLTEVDPWEIYIDASPLAGLRQIVREVGLEQVDGGRLLLRPFPTPAKDALSSTVGGQHVVAWPRVFSDLRMIGVRGEEAAEHLREQIGARQ